MLKKIKKEIVCTFSQMLYTESEHEITIKYNVFVNNPFISDYYYFFIFVSSLYTDIH